MSALWPGALRWTYIASSNSTRCSSTLKLDSLLTQLLRTSKRSYSSSSTSFRSLQHLPATSPTRPICSSIPQGAFASPVRALRTRPTQKRIPQKDQIPEEVGPPNANEPFSVITEYQSLPKNYKDGLGLTFRSHLLSEAEVKEWFGPGVDAYHANQTLRVLHGRRVAGTLEDPTYGGFHAVQRKMKEAALAWLRENVPVDEIKNAGLRAEEELAAMDQELIADSERIGIYSPETGLHSDPEIIARSKRLGFIKSTDEEINYQPNAQPAEFYPESALDTIRRINEEKYAEELAEQEEARKKQEEEIQQASGGDLTVNDLRSKVELRRPGEHPWLKYYIEEAKNTAPESPPEMTPMQRLLPSGLFALFTVAACIIFAATYVPPTHRLVSDVPPAAATVLTLITINACILLAWRIPPLWKYLNKYFMVIPAYPRAPAILGNMFSHQAMRHFAPNMIVLYIIGTRLCDQIDRGDFLAIYVSSGVIAAYVSMCEYVMRGVFVSSHLGASGAIFGVVAAYCWLNMDQELNVIFFPEGMLPTLPKYSSLVLLALAILNEFRILRKMRAVPGLKMMKIDIINHLGGYATGIVGGEMVRRKMMAKQKEKQGGILMMKKPVDALSR